MRYHIDVERFFTVKDFLYYYISGCIWLINLALTAAWQEASSRLQGLRLPVTQATAAFAVLLVVVPYVVGVLFSPLSWRLATFTRQLYGNPKRWMIRQGGGGKLRGVLSPLPEIEAARIIQHAEQTFGYRIDPHDWFLRVAAEFAMRGGTYHDAAERVKEVAASSNGLALPASIVIFRGAYVATNAQPTSLIAAAFLAVITWFLFVRRGEYLLEKRVQMTYLWFLLDARAEPVEG